MDLEKELFDYTNKRLLEQFGNRKTTFDETNELFKGLSAFYYQFSGELLDYLQELLNEND